MAGDAAGGRLPPTCPIREVSPPFLSPSPPRYGIIWIPAPHGEAHHSGTPQTNPSPAPYRRAARIRSPGKRAIFWGDSVRAHRAGEVGLQMAQNFEDLPCLPSLAPRRQRLNLPEGNRAQSAPTASTACVNVAPRPARPAPNKFCRACQPRCKCGGA